VVTFRFRSECSGFISGQGPRDGISSAWVDSVPEVFTSFLSSLFRGSALLRLSCVITICALPSYPFEAASSARLLPGEYVNAAVATGAPVGDSADPLTFHIVVKEGEGAVNILNRQTAIQPIVQVCGKNNEPIAGALVTFTSPSNGSGGVFLNGSRSISLLTDSSGHTGVVSMKPVGTGAFKLSVSASFHGQIATATVSQTNYATLASAEAAGAPGLGTPTGSATGARAAGLSTKAKGGIIAGIAAAAVLGTVVALSHGGGSSSASAVAIPTATIGFAGSPTTGAPH